MKHVTAIVVFGAALAAFATSARADDRADLIALDKAWGEAGVKGDNAAVAKLLDDGLVSVSEDGVRDKQGELADNQAPAGATYQPTDYKVVFLNADTAVMTHGTKGEQAHYSLHVWARKGGTWNVVATSTTPAAHK
jgi:Domain of unknown function (DUF4440)